MNEHDPVERLILELSRLPGVGERSAARLAVYLLKEAQGAKIRSMVPLAMDLARVLQEVVEGAQLCADCGNISMGSVCRIWRDQRRNRTLLCVVEHVSDLRALEGCGGFRGLYHVLHGALAPLDGIGPEQLGLDRLVGRVGHGDFQEVLVATGADVEGDTTALYIARLLRGVEVKITRLASGVPMGGELEYLDSATLHRAVAERRDFES